MNHGWIKIHRVILEKPIWTEATPEQKVILMTLLMMANHSEKQWEWQGESFTAQPGQFVTSLPSLVQKCGKNISIQKIRTALKRFERYGFLTDESTLRNRRITIVNWVARHSHNSRKDAIGRYENLYFPIWFLSPSYQGHLIVLDIRKTRSVLFEKETSSII